MMKRIIALAMLTALMAALLAACGDDAPAPTEPPTEPPAQLHTVAPRQEEPVIEWVSVEAQMTLDDADNLYAKGSDFVSFALIVTGEKAEIRFRLDDVTAAMLRGQPAGNRYYVTMDDKRLGDVTLNANCDELTLVGDYTYTQLCGIANRIRGLE